MSATSSRDEHTTAKKAERHAVNTLIKGEIPLLYAL